MKSLADIVNKRPFPDYSQWWQMGNEFLGFMSQAITSQWGKLAESHGGLSRVQMHLDEYIRLVYNREARPALAEKFHQGDFSESYFSGEFDALSYAFYRSAFESLADQYVNGKGDLARRQRSFSIRVGSMFFKALHDYLQLNLPPDLHTPSQFSTLQANIDSIGKFLLEQGYLRDNFAFTFKVNVTHAGNRIQQDSSDFMGNLQRNGVGYALYEMGYPAILPSAVYLFQMFGEAQHHSSRTIEELFEKVGYEACETNDFDPSEYPSDQVVELWTIRPKTKG